MAIGTITSQGVRRRASVAGRAMRRPSRVALSTMIAARIMAAWAADCQLTNVNSSVCHPEAAQTVKDPLHGTRLVLPAGGPSPSPRLQDDRRHRSFTDVTFFHIVSRG